MIRTFLRGMAIAMLAAGLAACATTTTGTGTTTTTVPVSLASAQAEASAILSAIQADAPALITTLSTTDQAEANTALSGLQSAVTAFVDLPANADPAQYASAVTAAVDGVVALLPLSPVTKLAIDAGGTLIDGLVAGLSSVNVTVPATTAPTAAPSLVLGSADVARAPIPIPLH